MEDNNSANNAEPPGHKSPEVSTGNIDGSSTEAPIGFFITAAQALLKNKKRWTRNARGLISQHGERFRCRYFPESTPEEWNDWHWQLRNRIRETEQLREVFRLSDEEPGGLEGPGPKLPVAITPYYAALLEEKGAEHPLCRTMLPSQLERIVSPEEQEDPLHEEHQSPVPGIIHRYPDRVLFYATGRCAAYCRYCTRSRSVGRKKAGEKNCGHIWDAAIRYIEEHKSIRDVLISGGDPLTLSDTRLGHLLGRLRKIPHVEILRIGTKTPMVLPQRITPSLTEKLKRYHPLFISIHCTHPDELTPEARAACVRLADAGIPLGSQTVLLSGVNDNAETLKGLFQGLLKIRVKPYYLYQCDPICGSAHFRTPVAKGMEILRELQGFTSGYALPRFVIDAPGGGGKIPLSSGSIVRKDPEGYVLRNYENRLFVYPETASAVQP